MIISDHSLTARRYRRRQGKGELCIGCQAKAASRRSRTFPRWRRSPICSSSGSRFLSGGARKNEQMQPIVDNSTTKTSAISAPILRRSRRPRPQKPDDNPDLSKKGAQPGGRRCASCHTDSYAGTKAVARVAGRARILLKALHDYKSACDPAEPMAAMADVAYP